MTTGEKITELIFFPYPERKNHFTALIVQQHDKTQKSKLKVTNECYLYLTCIVWHHIQLTFHCKSTAQN